VEKKTLIKVLENYSAQSEGEAKEVISLTAEFPFCQTFQVLSAKLSKDLSLPIQQTELQKAAVLIADRVVLKEIMMQEALRKPKIETSPVADNSEPEMLVVYKNIEKIIDTVDMADMVIKDLKKLNQLKHNFEMLFADQSTVSIPVASKDSGSEKTKPAEIAVKTEITEAKTEDSASQTDMSGMSRREKIIALAKAMTGSPETEPELQPKKKRKEQSDIIEEIKTLKEEIEPESERQKEQIQIIDHFIKTQPSISSTVKDRNPLPPADLNSTRSGEFGESIVSETLVEILIKQGKKDRAIEVLKKLIWKYPQKKAYFASRIEDLKK
jgi:hypothetical protein